MSDNPNQLLRLGQAIQPQPQNALAPRPTWAGAYDYAADWLAQQRAISSQRGLWDDAAGRPTAAGVVDAAQQYGNALMMGTTAPRASLLENPAFAGWFGKSRVANEAGEPLTVYHGTRADIAEFDAAKGKSKTDAPSWTTFFTDDPALAGSYAKRAGAGANVVPAHLSLQSPLEVTGRSWFALESPIEGRVWSSRYGQHVEIRRGDEVEINQLADLARQQGYDGLIARNIPDPARPSDKKLQTTYVAFKPEQVKSAIGNRGTYSPTDPRLVYGAGGLAAGTVAAAGSQRGE
jgi:hypothetical protein